ncbi:PocR ligand-binding domain-containing protein [Methanosarcina sp. DH2]|uniref:PocR ligand-binding domain-containing protein n=1 Tax=Methanosarcina sp. DH2 TaxID=2605639 RepID=UPI001E632301|nr:PocR ligand-binding domain-containing protein [Methanosarcina sp. DH2]
MALNRDITKHKKAEEESGQNEQHFGLKLENNLSTSRKAENLELAEIIDIQAVQSIMDDFYKFAHITMALLDLKGNVLIGIGWQDICTRFHRVHPETCKHCAESDTKLSAGVPPGEFKLYRCKNNMWDIVTPIIVAGQHVGNIFSGQFFFDDEPVDYELFRTQARKYGFNEEEYIAALEKVPRLSRETVENSMSFFMKLANMLSQLSHSNIKLSQSLEERNTLVDDLDRAQAVGNVGSWRLDVRKNELTWSNENHRIFGIPKGTPLTYETFLSTVHPDDREYVDNESKAGMAGKPYDIEHRIIVDGKIKWVREKAYLEFDKDGAVVSGFGITQDITERRQAEHQLSNELARATGLYELYTRSSNLSDRELYNFVLNQAVKITDSTIGFFHLVSEGEKEIILTTWNQEALKSCTAGNEGHYRIEKAGNWVDCVRLKRPVVYNDFPSSPNQKGLPAGHATVKRFMSVPVTENGKVRIIFGVGNKVDEYDDRDVMQLQLVANELNKIMKLRRIENEVRESEAFLRDIMENVSDAIFVKDREAQMILANPAYYRLMGESPEEVLNKTVADFHLPEIARKLAEDDKRVMETGKGTTLEERIFTSHGWRILQTVKAPYYDGQGNIIGLIGVARDITEHRQAEEALKKAHDSLEKLVEKRTAELEKSYNSLKESERSLAEAQKIAHLGSWDWNLVTGESYWSDEMYLIYGRNPQEPSATYKELLQYIHPEDRDYVSNAIKKALQGRPHRIDYRIILPDGEERTVHSQSEIIFDEKNIPIRMKGTTQDITERKKAEEALRNLEIIRKKEIHHRIKNNLQVISSLLDLQAEKFNNREYVKDSEIIEAFRESQDRVISIALIHEELHEEEGTTDTLNFSLYLQRLVESLFQTYKFGNTDISLNLDLEENIFFDMDTSVPLGMIVNELVSNSLKYAFPDKRTGEIQIELFSEEATSELDTRGELFEKGKRYSLIISDNGIGIPKQINLENTETLGLQLVNILVEQLDGQVELKRDNGTEFVISFGAEEKEN